MGSPVEPGDRVTVQGKPVQPVDRHRYFALNKPAGVVVTAHDPLGRTTVYDLLPGELRDVRLFSVGRLDVPTTGLVILTNDGDLAHRLSHPRHEVPKEYLALVRGLPTRRDLDRLRTGVLLEDGPTRPADVEALGSAGGLTRLRIVIAEGRNRQVRRMLEAIGHPAKALTRTAVGPVRLGRLGSGSCRRLRPAEVEALRRAVGLGDRDGRGAVEGRGRGR
jgi:23S rRNA pseudouridine2605 synthase